MAAAINHPVNSQPPANNQAHRFIVLDDEQINQNAVGRVVWWDLEGEVSRDALIKSLEEAGSPATPPDNPSDVVALHRAVDAVAKVIKGKPHQIKRGDWTISARRPTETGTVDAKDAKLIYDVQIAASIEGETVKVEGDPEGRVRAAFDLEKKSLAPTDIGTWLCAKVRGVGGIPLREAGGFYFVPADVWHKIAKVKAAVAAVSKHKIQELPSMRTEAAVQAVLAAIEADTLKACDDIDAEIRDGKLGKRALESRSDAALDRLELVERYEKLLGHNLDKLRSAVAAVQCSIASAQLALATSDAE